MACVRVVADGTSRWCESRADVRVQCAIDTERAFLASAARRCCVRGFSVRPIGCPQAYATCGPFQPSVFTSITIVQSRPATQGAKLWARCSASRKASFQTDGAPPPAERVAAIQFSLHAPGRLHC